MNRARAWIGPLLLLVIVTGSYWKLLTKQYTWADHPDMAYQVLPWYEFEAVSFQHGEFPLWDPHVWGGQPLLAQMQPGAAYPLNWPLFLLPLRNGHVQLLWLNLYFVLTHFLAALFCYWLCRDSGRSVSASVLGGFAFALGGLVGSIEWPQMLNGAVWIPLVFLFYVRSTRGRRPLASAALAGTFLGFSFLSGHPQIPTFTGLMMAGLWIVEIVRRRFAALGSVALFALFTVLVSAFQMLPGIEYGMHSIRWVGSTNPVGWGQAVPYVVHQQYSLPPLGVLGFVLAGGAEYTFMGIAVVTLALLGFAMAYREPVVRALGGVCAGGLLFALGGASVFHGVAYLVIPMVEKARTPAFAVVIVQFALAVLAAYGLDSLRAKAAGRLPVGILLAVGIAIWPVLAVASKVRPQTGREYEELAVAGLAALALGTLLRAWKSRHISERAAVALICVTALFELGTVTGRNFQSREKPAGFLAELEKNRDVVDFLRKQPDFVRLETDTDAVPYNIGDWDGIDQFRCYLGGMTSNLVPFEIERLHGGDLAVRLFALNYSAGAKPFRAGQTEAFRGASGLHIYRNPEAFPLVWTIHQADAVNAADLVPRLLNADLRQKTFLIGKPPALDRCGDSDGVQLTGRQNTRVAVEAHMACKGMVVLSRPWYPGWQTRVDGRPAHLYQVDGALQGVVVDSGAHEIEFRYRPASVYWGASLTASGLAIALFLSVGAPFVRTKRIQ